LNQGVTQRKAPWRSERSERSPGNHHPTQPGARAPWARAAQPRSAVPPSLTLRLIHRSPNPRKRDAPTAAAPDAARPTNHLTDHSRTIRPGTVQAPPRNHREAQPNHWRAVDCPPTRTAEAQPYQTPHRSCPASVREFRTFISPTINHFRQIRPILRTSEPYTHAISEFPGALYLMPEPNTQSTGPRTEAGKATSSMNALKHGLSITRHVILKHEDAAEFETLARELHSIFEPQSPRERLAVEEITHCKWALRRFERAEAFMLEFPATPHHNDQQDIPAEAQTRLHHHAQRPEGRSPQRLPGHPQSAALSRPLGPPPPARPGRVRPCPASPSRGRPRAPAATRRPAQAGTARTPLRTPQGEDQRIAQTKANKPKTRQ
jgi:hypothetical protein